MSEDPLGIQTKGVKPLATAFPNIAPGQVPKEFTDSEANLFGYCNNDPLDRTDPFGLEDIHVSLEMDRLGYEASMNSLREYLARGSDGTDRSQLIQRKDGKLSLQQTFNKGELITKYEWKDGRVRKQYSQREQATADKGYTAPGAGHVHADVTGQPSKHSSDFSPDDRKSAKGGQIIYKVNESKPGVVTRLTPQIDGSAAIERPVLPQELRHR